MMLLRSLSLKLVSVGWQYLQSVCHVDEGECQDYWCGINHHWKSMDEILSYPSATLGTILKFNLTYCTVQSRISIQAMPLMIVHEYI